MRATVPERFFALSNGDLLGVAQDEGTREKSFHWRFDEPHSCYLITLVAGGFVLPAIGA